MRWQRNEFPLLKPSVALTINKEKTDVVNAYDRKSKVGESWPQEDDLKDSSDRLIKDHIVAMNHVIDQIKNHHIQGVAQIPNEYVYKLTIIDHHGTHPHLETTNRTVPGSFGSLSIPINPFKGF